MDTKHIGTRARALSQHLRNASLMADAREVKAMEQHLEDLDAEPSTRFPYGTGPLCWHGSANNAYIVKLCLN